MFFFILDKLTLYSNIIGGGRENRGGEEVKIVQNVFYLKFIFFKKTLEVILFTVNDYGDFLTIF